jgi:hypothetical protein
MFQFPILEMIMIICLLRLKNETLLLLALEMKIKICLLRLKILMFAMLQFPILEIKMIYCMLRLLNLILANPLHTVEHTSICTRCRDVDIDAIHDHMALIKQQNDHIAKLDAKIAEHELENEKIKFARSTLYRGRRPGIKDGIGFQQGGNVKLNAPPKKLSNFVKGKAPMPQDNEGYILYPVGYPESKIRRIHSRKSHSGPNHAFMYKGETSSSRQPNCVKLPKKTPSASNDHDISFKTFDASYVLTNKSGKVVAKYVGGKHKGSKTCVWVPKILVSNAKGPKTIWVPKVKN